VADDRSITKPENDERNNNDIKSEQDLGPSEKRIISSSSTIHAMMMAANPGSDLMDKLEPAHITQMFENDEKQSERDFKNQHENRNFIIILASLVIIFVIVFCLLFRTDKEMIDKIVIPLATLVVGGFGGYGIGVIKRK
jgi:hypothetical protein